MLREMGQILPALSAPSNRATILISALQPSDNLARVGAFGQMWTR